MLNEEIEIQLWEYIDGTCTPEEQERVASLIATNEDWKTLYNELKTLDHSISSNITSTRLPQDFSSTVMNRIEITPSKKRTAILLDFGIKGIAAFFAISILSTIIYLLSQANWGATNTYKQPYVFQLEDIQLPHINTDILFNNSALYITAFLVTIMAIVLIENFFTKKRLKTI